MNPTVSVSSSSRPPGTRSRRVVGSRVANSLSSARTPAFVSALRRVDLQPDLPGPGVLGEYVQDQLGAIDDSQLELALQVALLARAQILVADQDVVAGAVLRLAELLHLAFADEQRGIDLGPALDIDA